MHYMIKAKTFPYIFTYSFKKLIHTTKENFTRIYLINTITFIFINYSSRIHVHACVFKATFPSEQKIMHVYLLANLGHFYTSIVILSICNLLVAIKESTHMLFLKVIQKSL